MLMNAMEKTAIDNPVRRALQRFYEVPALLRLGGGPLAPGSSAVEIGCGVGHGIGLILNRFGAARVDGVDLDPTLLDKARCRWTGDARVRLAQGSATDLAEALGAQDGAYDAVFDFAIIHHVPDWRTALAEVSRVLRPGGRFFFDEVTAHALARPTYRRLFDHPTEDRFTAAAFVAELPRHGLVPLGSLTRIQGDYLLGAARRAPAS